MVSEKHGGVTETRNLAFACTLCNRAKGTDVGSFTAEGVFVRFFNPRVDRWEDHFRLRGSVIEPQTAIGEVTEKILGLNVAERLIERELLQRIGRYPPVRVASLESGDDIVPNDDSG